VDSVGGGDKPASFQGCVGGIIGPRARGGNAEKGNRHAIRTLGEPLPLRLPTAHRPASYRMFGSLFQTMAAALGWVVANVVYLDMKRKGARGFTRFAAFWAGTPTTWITLFAVREGKQPTFERGADEEDLLREIRRDRALRSGSEGDS
jgi:hypothetical protein